MSDSISRQEAIDALMQEFSDAGEDEVLIECGAYWYHGTVISVLKALPSADRPTGKWDENGNCTNCGEHAPYWAMATTYYRSNYCPNCGARMKVKNVE